MRKTKIICTLGPSTDVEGVMEKLVDNGMDVARFNFSHASHEEHYQRLVKLIEIREQRGKHIAALLDTKGPEIRIKSFENGKITLVEGELFALTTEEIKGDEKRVSITYKNLINDLKIGDKVLIDDGLIELIVEEKTETDIICRVLNGGVISNNKGVNVPGVTLTMPYISETDKRDIIFGAESGFDFIAASFVSSASDVLQIRRVL